MGILDIITEIAPPAVTGLVTGIGGYLIGKPKEKRSDFDTIIGVITEERDSLLQRLSATEEKINILEQKYIAQKITYKELQNKLILLETSHHDLPFPQWLKDTDCRVLSINQSFEDLILQPIGMQAHDLIGTYDRDHFPEELAKEYARTDKLAMSSPKGYWVGKDPLPPGLVLEEGQDWFTIKYSRFLGNTLIGVAGMVIIHTDKK
jgi:hypothetical protein